MVPSAELEPVRDYQWILSPTQLFLKDTTKNKSSFRTLPLSDATVDMLLKMKQRQEKMKLHYKNRYNHEFDDYIYVFENGD